LGERLLIGLTIGVVLITMISFVAGLVFGIGSFVIWPILALTTVCALVSFFHPMSHRLPPVVRTRSLFSRVDGLAFMVFLFAISFFWVLAGRLIMWDGNRLATGIIDNWGDLPFHLGVTISFLNGGSFPPPDPTFSGHPLTYPFLSNFFSAMLMLTGIPLEHAFELPTILMNSVFITLLFYIAYRLVRNLLASVLTPLLFLLAGGLGFLWFFSDIYFGNEPVWNLLSHLPRRYTNLGELGIHWINPTLAHLLPQRSFLFGLPLAVSMVLLWWVEKDKKNGNAWLPGILAGLLPLSHTHNFLAMMIVSACLAMISIVKRDGRKAALRYWTVFYAVTFAIAVPQLVYLLGSEIPTRGFLRFEVGWMAGSENIIWFWLKNTSMILPMLLAAFLFAKPLRLRRQAIIFYFPFGLLLIICNLFLFSPLAYDTNKVFLPALLFAMPFVALVLSALYRSRSWWLKGFVFRVFLVSLILSGSLNLIHELQGGGWQEYTREEVELARQIQGRTESGAIFLTAPIHNNLLMLAGRQVVLGYPGHVYSHGLDQAPAEEAVATIYSGQDTAEENIRRYNVDYIVVGPHERSKYGQSVEWLRNRFPQFARTQNYVIYRCNG
jgi:uncharacterized membrane protein